MEEDREVVEARAVLDRIRRAHAQRVQQLRPGDPVRAVRGDVKQRLLAQALHPRRRLPIGQIGGRADREHLLLEQQGRGGLGPLAGAVLDGEVQAVAAEVGRPVGGDQLHVDAGMVVHVAREPRAQPQEGDGVVGRHRHLRPRGLPAQPLRRVGDVPQAGGDRVVQLVPFRRQFQAPVRAPEQREAEVVLEALHPPADGGLRHRELAGGPGEAEVPRGRLEHHQRVGRGQIPTEGLHEFRSST